MLSYYKPTENITLKHFHFRSNIQRDREAIIAFCNEFCFKQSIAVSNVHQIIAQQKILSLETKSSLTQKIMTLAR